MWMAIQGLDSGYSENINSELCQQNRKLEYKKYIILNR